MIVNAFIPARGGSQGVPKKNIRNLGSKPLIKHTIDFALSAHYFNKVIVSTDSADIATIASNYEISIDSFENIVEDTHIETMSGITLHKRKKNQAQTLSPIRETLFDLAKDNHALSNFDYFFMLQPTSPFRKQSEIVSIQRVMEEDDDWTSIASFTDVGGMHPDRMWRMAEKYNMTPFMSQLSGDNKPRQLLEKLYIKDGAYYVLRKSVLQNAIMLGDKVKSVIRDGIYTVNIDTELDFTIAELINEKYLNF